MTDMSIEDPPRIPTTNLIPYEPKDDIIYQRRCGVLTEIIHQLEYENNLIALKIAQLSAELVRRQTISVSGSIHPSAPLTTSLPSATTLAVPPSTNSANTIIPTNTPDPSATTGTMTGASSVAAPSTTAAPVGKPRGKRKKAESSDTTTNTKTTKVRAGTESKPRGGKRRGKETKPKSSPLPDLPHGETPDVPDDTPHNVPDQSDHPEDIADENAHIPCSSPPIPPHVPHMVTDLHGVNGRRTPPLSNEDELVDDY